eukprot:5301680-Amphidinium_carterae.1
MQARVLRVQRVSLVFQSRSSGSNAKPLQHPLTERTRVCQGTVSDDQGAVPVEKGTHPRGQETSGK